MTVEFAIGILVGALGAIALILLVRLIQDYEKDHTPMAARQPAPRRDDGDCIGRTDYKTIGREGWVIPYIKLPRGFVKMSDETLTDISIRFSHLKRELEEAKAAQPLGMDRLQEIREWRDDLHKARDAIYDGNFGTVGFYLGHVMLSVEAAVAKWSTEGKDASK